LNKQIKNKRKYVSFLLPQPGFSILWQMFARKLLFFSHLNSCSTSGLSTEASQYLVLSRILAPAPGQKEEIEAKLISKKFESCLWYSVTYLNIEQQDSIFF